MNFRRYGRILILALILLSVMAASSAWAEGADAQGPVILLNGEPVEEAVLNLSAGSQLRFSSNQPVVWKSSKTSRAVIDQTGLLTGKKTGTLVITATAANGQKASCEVRVARLVTGISISGPTEVASGKKIRLTASAQPSNASNRKVTWSSSDPSVATVNSSGYVKAGKVDGVRPVVITARAKDGSGVVAMRVITVRPAVQKVVLLAGGAPMPKTLTIDLTGEKTSLDLDALLWPTDAGQQVKWKVSSSSRAKVDENGVVTALKTGSVTVTATAQDGSGKKASVKVSIVRGVKEIKITGGTALAGGKSTKLKASVSPSNATKKSVTWISSDPSVATVSKSGTVKAAKVTERKQVTIYARATDGSGVAGSITMTIAPSASKVIMLKDGKEVSKLGIDLAGAPKVQLAALVGPGEASQQVRWVSSNTKRATVDQNGVVTALKKGTVTISAIAQDGSGKKATCRIEIGVLAKQVVVTGAKKVTTGQEVELEARVLPSNASDKDVVWTSSNPSVAKVNKYGEVTGGEVAAATQATIYATAADGGGAVCEYTITVVPAASRISITRTDKGMASALILNQNGQTAKLSAWIYPAEAQQGVAWKSSNKKVASVDQNGVITPGRKGVAIITATAKDGSGVKATLRVGVGNTSAIPYYLEVDNANQVVRVYERGADGSYSRLIRRMICSTGKLSTPGLDNGLYPMDGSRMVWMTSVANSYAIYATRIDGHILFHSVTYPTRSMSNLDTVAYNKLGERASLGCIRLLAADAKWIYDNVPEDCFVNVMAGSRRASEYGAVSAPPLVGGKWDPTNPHPDNPDYDPTYTSAVK